MTTLLSRWMARHAAILVLEGLLKGGLVSSAMTGQSSADLRAALASPLNALLGAFWVLGVRWSLPMLRFGGVGRRRLGGAIIPPAVRILAPDGAAVA